MCGRDTRPSGAISCNKSTFAKTDLLSKRKLLRKLLDPVAGFTKSRCHMPAGDMLKERKSVGRIVSAESGPRFDIAPSADIPLSLIRVDEFQASGNGTFSAPVSDSL